MPHALKPGNATLYLEVALDAEEFETAIGSYLGGPWLVEVGFERPDEEVHSVRIPIRRRISTSVILRPDGCICIEFTDTGGFRIADATCPVHGVDGTDPGDGEWETNHDLRNCDDVSCEKRHLSEESD